MRLEHYPVLIDTAHSIFQFGNIILAGPFVEHGFLHFLSRILDKLTLFLKKLFRSLGLARFLSQMLPQPLDLLPVFHQFCFAVAFTQSLRLCLLRNFRQFGIDLPATLGGAFVQLSELQYLHLYVMMQSLKLVSIVA
jgi:hypothetical protein